MGKKIIVIGHIKQAKGGTIIVTENNEIYYIEADSDLNFLNDQKVEVTGILKEKTETEDLKDKDGNSKGGYKKGTIRKIITKPTWKIVS